MAQQSFRFQPRQIGRYFWRVEISSRSSDVDDHHFKDEWTGSIPQEPATSFTFFSLPKLSMKALDASSMICMDRCEFVFAWHPYIAAWLDPYYSVTAEVRLWFSVDNTNWTPCFWGDINLNDVRRPLKKVVGSTYIKTWSFTAYDCLSKLDKIAFHDCTRMDTTTYIPPLAIACFIGNVVDPQAHFGTQIQSVWPKNTGFNPRIISIKYYLEQVYKYCFDEHYYETVSAEPVWYGYGVTAIDCAIGFRAYTGNGSISPSIVKGYQDLYLWYDVFADELEFNKEWKTWAEFMQGLCALLGFTVTTQHTIEGGRWVRTAVYLRMDGENDKLITVPDAVVTDREETDAMVGRQCTTCTSRFMNGGYRIADYTTHPLQKEEQKITTWWRTVGNMAPNDPMCKLSGEMRMKILWQTMLVYDSVSTAYYVVNSVDVNYGSIFETYPGTTATFGDYALEYQNGVSTALAEYYNLAVGPNASMLTITEEYSRMVANDGSTSSINHLSVLSKISDMEWSPLVFRILEIEMDPDKNHCTIIKALSPS